MAFLFQKHHQKNRSTKQGRQNAQRQSPRCKIYGTDRRIRPDDEDGSDEPGSRQGPRVTGTHKPAGDMRRHEPDEPDRPDSGFTLIVCRQIPSRYWHARAKRVL